MSRLQGFGADGQLKTVLIQVSEAQCEVCRMEAGGDVADQVPLLACPTHYKACRAAVHDRGINTAEFDR